MASIGERLGGISAEDIAAAQREKVRQVVDNLAAITAVKLRMLGFDKAAEALEQRDSSLDSSRVGVNAYATAHDHPDHERRAALSTAYAIDKIADMSSRERPGTDSEPIIERDGTTLLDLSDGRLTRIHLYTMLDLHKARDEAEPAYTPLSHDRSGAAIPAELTGAYRQERCFNSGVLEVDIVESIDLRADGSPFNGRTYEHTVYLRRTDFGLPTDAYIG